MKSYYVLYPAIFLALLLSVAAKSSRHGNEKAEPHIVQGASEVAEAPNLLASKLKK